MNSRPRWRRILRVVAIAAVLLVAAGIVAGVVISKPRPKGKAGREAERLAQEMLLAVNAEAWKETGAVRFTFQNHKHLWDRKRNYHRVDWGNKRVLFRIGSRTGRAWEKGMEANSSQTTELVQKAYAYWVNDSFWLNPIVKIYDAGVTRSIVRDADDRLLVAYSSGGLTPGDAYLWTPGANGEPPTQWRMWVSNLPIGGLAATWEGWITLSTGAKVSTLHRIGPLKLKLEDVAGARSLQELLGSAEDPFAKIRE